MTVAGAESEKEITSDRRATAPLLASQLRDVRSCVTTPTERLDGVGRLPVAKPLAATSRCGLVRVRDGVGERRTFPSGAAGSRRGNVGGAGAGAGGGEGAGAGAGEGGVGGGTGGSTGDGADGGSGGGFGGFGRRLGGSGLGGFVFDLGTSTGGTGCGSPPVSVLTGFSASVFVVAVTVFVEGN